MATTSIAVGSWGGKGGDSWDDGTGIDGIRSITLYAAGCIDSISVVYEKNKEHFDGGKHGGGGGSQYTISLDYPDEYLKGVSGFLGTYGGYSVVRSLTFHSNKKDFGPYGTQEGTTFDLPVEGGRIVGFWGHSGVYVDSIGCHIASN